MKLRTAVQRVLLVGSTFVLLLTMQGCVQPQQATTPPTPATQPAPATEQATQASSEDQTVTITDVANRTVKIPKEIKNVVTLGSVPVINSFLFAVGEADKIRNGLPDFARKPRWKYQTVFAPGIKDEPKMQAASGEPMLEEMLKANPDVVFTMDKPSLDILEKNGIAAVYLSWKQPEDVKQAITLVGQVFHKEAEAAQYITYFDDTLKKVQGMVGAIPADKKVKVLNCSITKLSQPHLIAEWWITEAGGISVTNDGRTKETMEFSMEQLLKWNPDVMIVTDKKEREQLLTDSRFANIQAVKDKKIFVGPVGAHIWANRTIEQPLMVLWAAKMFYPDQCKDLNLEQELAQFYSKFFHYDMKVDEAKEILSGNL